MICIKILNSFFFNIKWHSFSWSYWKAPWAVQACFECHNVIRRLLHNNMLRPVLHQSCKRPVPMRTPKSACASHTMLGWSTVISVETLQNNTLHKRSLLTSKSEQNILYSIACSVLGRKTPKLSDQTYSLE